MSETYLTREAAANFCTQLGFPVAKTTLQKYATVGGGPVYRKFGNRVLYSSADLNEWIESKLSAPIQSSSAVQS